MDRDAAAPPFEVVPPVCWKVARGVAAAGGGMILLAALLGLVSPGEGVVGTARVLLVFVGAVTAGVGVWLRPDRWEAWAIGGAAAVVAVFGTPAHWDSFRLVFGVFAVVAGFRLVLVLAPPGWKLGLVAAYMLFHFAGIFCATTAPAPTPWLVDQAYLRVYNQYLQFIYMRNAYHFYSPEPGPAALLACLVKTENGTETTATGEVRKKYDTRWVVMPRRPADVRDPLALSYFRRLSLTDRVSRSSMDFTTAGAFEKTEVRTRRYKLTLPGSDPYYPLHPTEPEFAQYRMPDPNASRFLIPSYAQHLILEHTPNAEAAARTTLKMYRLEHRTLPVEAFIGVGNPDGVPTNPYNPMTYRPYFLGEYRLTSEDPNHPRKARVELVDPQADMLYWLIPIMPNAGPGADKKPFVDHLSIHAGHAFDWSQLR
ncbi:hypothetical protein [Urbifossiella limnaea]|uniref:Uncharacterized protein n=1 Tax=Urbifossiella limnaea TaxID=2528023 RepID=A0A517XQA9_9BACT|nr:hypothetical protein [Urbifossiella limnaea]QDU19691.1 hypothetical protein ETAA1_16220 [Urbifossiella limnaea]